MRAEKRRIGGGNCRERVDGTPEQFKCRDGLKARNNFSCGTEGGFLG